VVGIVILLAGVWVVSIQTGGGGVDVDRWKKGDEPLSDDDEDTISVISEPRHVEGDPQITGQSQSLLIRDREQQTFGPAPMERQSVSESNIQMPPRRQSLRIRALTADDVSTLPIPITLPQSPSAHHRITSDAILLLSPSIARARRRRRSTLQPTDTHHSLSPPLGSSSVLGGGLSIGLGPMSPGFSIVPLDRRRRISGLGFADVVEETRGQRRRTVSEGDVRRLAGGVEGVEEAVEDTEQEDSGELSTEESGKANMRWNWVRAMFSGRT